VHALILREKLEEMPRIVRSKKYVEIGRPLSIDSREESRVGTHQRLILGEMRGRGGVLYGKATISA